MQSSSTNQVGAIISAAAASPFVISPSPVPGGGGFGGGGVAWINGNMSNGAARSFRRVGLILGLGIAAAGVWYGANFMYHKYFIPYSPSKMNLLDSDTDTDADEEKSVALDQLDDNENAAADTCGEDSYEVDDALEWKFTNATINSPLVILHQCPRGRRTPSIAPYTMKLETFLRVHGIEYKVNFSPDGPHHPSNSTPLISFDLEDVKDSQNRIDVVCKKYGLDPDAHVPAGLKPIGRAFSHMFENHIYWGIVLWRWVYDGATHLHDIQVLSPQTMRTIPNLCKTLETAAWFHGLGKNTPGYVVDSILHDLHSLSEFLGERQYFLTDDKPSELDCTAFGILAQMLWNMDESPFHLALLEDYSNLADFCHRMREKYWPDWEQCLNNEEILDTYSNPIVPCGGLSSMP